MSFFARLGALGLGLLTLSACQPAPVPLEGQPVCHAGTSIDLNAMAPAFAGSVTAAPNWNAPHVAGHLLLFPRGGSLSAQSLRTLQVTLEARGLSVKRPTAELLSVMTPTGQSDQELAHELARTMPHIWVQPDFLYAPLEIAPNDPGFPGQTGIQVGSVRAYQDYLTTIRAPQAWTALQACGLPIKAAEVAIIDTHVELTHPELQGRIEAQYSYLSGRYGVSVSDHGTAVAGMIASLSNNAQGLTGLTWSGSVTSHEAISQAGASTSQIVAALNNAVTEGARVINLSLGYSTPPGDAALDAALTAAGQKALLVAAAGNTADSGLAYPASHPAVLAVGAVGRDPTQLACYSGRPTPIASHAFIVAPGGGGSVLCPGVEARDDLLVLAPGGGYALRSGSSFAAPQVSAVAALMFNVNPALTPAQVSALLLDNTDRSSGLPLLNAEAALKATLASQGSGNLSPKR